tara:strand:- start:628 stop:849 length:222 start_codon:yes stop_codon:yes gene_type:complete
MVRGNSLGSIVEPQLPLKNKPETNPKDIVIEVNQKTIDKIRANGSAIMCCAITTVLVGVGVGIAIWYAVTEIN